MIHAGSPFRWLRISGLRPGWVLPGAAVDLNFATNQYWAGSYQAATAFLSCARAQTVSSYATDATGLLIPFAANILRVTSLGLLIEEARTNVVTWNRDLTNAAWTLGATMTVANNQTGADGTANAASSITGGAVSLTNTILNQTTIASSARFQSAYVKRLVGSGTVNMTMDGGTTWTAITVTAAYTKITIPTQTMANPNVGFQIITSGDSIAVDFVQNENGTFATSPIPTTTVAMTRNADVVTASNAFLTALNKTSISVFIKALWSPLAFGMIIEGQGTTGISMSSNGSKNKPDPVTHIGSSATARGDFASGEGTSYNAGDVSRWGISLDGVNTPVASNNGTTMAKSATGEAEWATPIYIGSRSGTALFWDNYIQRIAVGGGGLSQGLLNSIISGIP